MADAKYLANRLKYHTASRIATQTGEALAQALNVDGHIITTNKVWAAPANAFAYNENTANTDSFDATTDLVAVFKKPVNGSSVTSGDIAGGKWWENTAYPAVRLYEGVKMTKVKGSDGGGKFQAFEVLAGADGKSSGTLRLTDWIAPTAVADPTTGLPVAGYSGIPMYSGTVLKKSNTDKWAESIGSYEFAYISGLLTFEPGFTPQDVYSAAGASATENITLTAFKYIGAYLSDTLTAMSQNTANSMMAIKPYIFNASGMTLTNGDKDLQIQIPGIVFNVFDNRTGLAYGDLEYNYSGTNSYTVFTIEDFQNTDIVYQQNDATEFTAMSFVLASGLPVPVMASGTLPVASEP